MKLVRPELLLLFASRLLVILDAGRPANETKKNSKDLAIHLMTLKFNGKGNKKQNNFTKTKTKNKFLKSKYNKSRQRRIFLSLLLEIKPASL